MLTVTNDRPKNPGTENGPVDLGQWVAANQPRLHPTRQKVLSAVQRLAGHEGTVTSRDVRERVGISQQLLNRHLRGLESQGLLRLTNPGPGLPLEASITAAGLRTLGLRGPHLADTPAPAPVTEAPAPAPVAAPPAPEVETAAPVPETPEAPAPVAPAPMAEAPARRDLGSLGLFSSGLYRALGEHLQYLEPSRFGRIVRRALSDSLSQGLYQALRPHLIGLDQAGFTSMVRAAAAEALGRPREEAPESQAWLPRTREEAPALNAAEAALEQRLDGRANPLYKGMPWYARSREFSAEWDRMRRRRLGILVTSFDSFRPRWEHPSWEAFNLGRRQADAAGADYTDWVRIQWERVRAEGRRGLEPDDLAGEAAQAAYRKAHGDERGARPVRGQAPYTAKTFRLDNPDHVSYVEDLLEEIEALSANVFPDDKQAPVRLLAQAIASGSIPVAACDLRPSLKPAVMELLSGGSQKQRPAISAVTSGGQAEGRPQLII